MRRVSLLLVCLFGTVALAQESPTANEIMARVAINQDRAEKLRQEYVYQQHVHVISSLTNGRVMREETDDYDVFPTPDGSKKELKTRTGRYFEKGKYVPISIETKANDHDGLDGELTSDFARDVLNDKSKDGIGRHLFPLTTKEQKDCAFRLLGEAEQDGRSVYRIGFSPIDKDDFKCWAGEALIDKQDLEPVLVFTKMPHKLPLMIRGALGTDLPGIGFSVHYRRQPDGVWFPVSFGTEFRLKLLFVMKRNIVLSLENKNFKHTHVESRITAVEPTQ
jgi:hypothetical protein